jgi:Arc/MetJ-type ribon-helix-helix transcriptional regulator
MLERTKMSGEDWKEMYNKIIKEWKEGYQKALDEWKEKLGEAKMHIKQNIPETVIPPLPPKFSIPPMPAVFPFHTGRSNVVASRIGDEELKSIDMMVEAGLFETRSEAVAYFVSEGIKARKDVLDKVSSALEEIRKLRKEAEEQVQTLRKKVGMTETEKPESEGRTCPKCGKDLSELPEDIAVCPYCGTKIKKD